MRNSDSAQALSLLARGREYECLTPSQFSNASTVVASLRGAVVDTKHGLVSLEAMLSASAVRRINIPD